MYRWIFNDQKLLHWLLFAQIESSSESSFAWLGILKGTELQVALCCEPVISSWLFLCFTVMVSWCTGCWTFCIECWVCAGKPGCVLWTAADSCGCRNPPHTRSFKESRGGLIAAMQWANSTHCGQSSPRATKNVEWHTTLCKESDLPTLWHTVLPRTWWKVSVVFGVSRRPSSKESRNPHARPGEPHAQPWLLAELSAPSPLPVWISCHAPKCFKMLQKQEPLWILLNVTWFWSWSGSCRSPYTFQQSLSTWKNQHAQQFPQEDLHG